MRRVVVALVMALGFVGVVPAVGAEPVPPVEGDIGAIHDPTMVQDGDHWYVLSTNGSMVITRSTDRVHWERIGSVFPDDRIILPTEVKGDKPTLRQAVLADRWPTLKESRGKIIFTLDTAGAKRTMYRSLRPDVDDRLIFVNASPPDDDAAYVVMNNPIADADEIEDLVRQGFLVRSRADADTVQARTGDTTMRDAAWASGAHFISTDYLQPDPRFTDYVGTLPTGETIRCNPFSAPEGCRAAQLVG